MSGRYVHGSKAMGSHFGVFGAPPVLIFSVDWDVHWGYEVNSGSVFCLFLGVIKVRKKCGCLPSTHHFGGDFGRGKIMRPVNTLESRPGFLEDLFS